MTAAQYAIDSPTTCLIVDDSVIVRMVARRIIEELGFSVSEATDGDEALHACAVYMPDVILLDWNMPNMDGYDFLQTLRRTASGHHPKILFCTTRNNVSAIALALQAGADEYIMKPFSREIITDKLAHIGLVQQISGEFSENSSSNGNAIPIAGGNI